MIGTQEQTKLASASRQLDRSLDELWMEFEATYCRLPEALQQQFDEVWKAQEVVKAELARG